MLVGLGEVGTHIIEFEIINLLQVSTGDSWVARNWSEVFQWTAETALAVLQKDLIATYEESIKHNLEMPFNALASIQLDHSMDHTMCKEKPKAKYKNDHKCYFKGKCSGWQQDAFFFVIIYKPLYE